MIYMRAPSGEVFKTDRPEWHSECERLTRKEGEAAMREQAAKELRAMLKPGATVYTLLRHVTASRTMRHISLLIVNKGEVRDISHLAATALAAKVADDGGIKVGGGGMDMGFDLVYRLGRALWPKGTRKPHGIRNGEPDRDGGYALKHQWL